ncbi:hypothetical protein [Pyrococcus abyssi]|nr:hypothetical protein [Pyrococcus abyssi]
MDFALFMEKYGYKILLALVFLVVFGIFGVTIFGLIKATKTYGVAFGVLLLVLIFVRMLVNRRYYEAYGEAMAKYFYDNRKR